MTTTDDLDEMIERAAVNLLKRIESGTKVPPEDTAAFRATAAYWAAKHRLNLKEEPDEKDTIGGFKRDIAAASN